jgi:hypothetical protein
VRITIEMPDQVHRDAKSRAAELGMPLRQFVSEAVAEKLRQNPSTKGKPWMKSFGGLRHLHQENVQIQKLIDEEFGGSN